MALTTQEEQFVKDLYQDSLKKSKNKTDEDTMWNDVENIMKRNDINEGEKAELRRQRKIEYYDSIEIET